jgi:hypothetical protein
MRSFVLIWVAICLLVAGTSRASAQTPPARSGGAAAPPSAASIEAATKVLADARQALGGETKQAAVKTIIATGRTRRVSGENLVPVEFEIDVELPDKYVRKDEIPAQESTPSSNGFNGDSLIQFPAPPPAPAAPRGGTPAPVPAAGGAANAAGGTAGAAGGAASAAGRAGGPALSPEQQQEAARKARVASVKQDFARLMLGMFAKSTDVYPLTFSHAGQAEAPQGKADVINIAGPANFAARMFVMSDTHLPIMISWTVPATPANLVITAPGQPKPPSLSPGAIVVEGPAPPPAGASKDDQDAYNKALNTLRVQALMGKSIEHRLYFSDYRDTDGLQFPFRLRHAIGTDTIEETTFDRFRLNAKIDAKRFEPVK